MNKIENNTLFSTHKNPYEYNGETIDNQLLRENLKHDKYFYVGYYYRHFIHLIY